MPHRETIAPGSAVDRYEVVEIISSGGMGEVYHARDPVLERDLVLKVLPHRARFDKDALERFVREARAASALNHPNIVTIYAIGEAENCHFIAMELVQGQTLRVMGGAGLDGRKVAHIGEQAARALAVAHEAGIVHRDIKPENVMVRPDGYVKVLDFGIAQLSSADAENARDSRLTRPGTVVGTMRYMSPEQASAAEVSPASDIFSLGILLYELATGRHPFEASSDMGVIGGILLREPVPASRMNARVSRELDAILARMLAKAPADRPAAIEVASLLNAFADAGSDPGHSDVDAGRQGEIVGRELEKSALRDEFAAASAGRVTVVCISGEPGIGKTTLVEDFLSELGRASSHVVARGRCSERLAGAEAYLPILDAIEDLLRSDNAGVTRAALDTHAPSWRKQVAPFDTDPGAPTAPAASQERLKRELVAFMKAICSSRTLVLFLEDIHWADASTVDMLAYIVTRLDDARLLMIASFRPTELQLVQHPFLALKLDLQTKGIARELQLAFLTRDEVAVLLALKFPGSPLPSDVPRMVHARTEGNPLFVTDIAEYLQRKGAIREVDGKWTVAQSLSDLERELPESMRSMVERKIGQLSEADCLLLSAASVQGYSFDSVVVAAALNRDPGEVEDRLDELDRIHTFVQRRDEHDFPDGTFSSRYRFVHVLYQNALYASLSVSKRIAMSRAVGDALLRFHNENPEVIASELAFLFETARDAGRASEYFVVASRNAARVFANEEAAMAARRGLSQLARIPDGGERKARELALHSVLGTSVAATQGYAAPEVLTSMARARVLADELGQQPKLAPVMWGLFGYYLVSGDIPEAQSMADHYCRWATELGDPLSLVGAHTAVAISLYFVGDFRGAIAHCEEAERYYDLDKRPVYHAMYRMDPGVFFLSEKARNLWVVGRPDAALATRDRALGLGAESPDPRSQAYALLMAGVLHQLRREPALSLDYAARCIAICDDHGIAQERMWAMAGHGWALAQLGRADEGVREIEASLAVQRGPQAQLSLRIGLRPLVEALICKGDYEGARDAAREGLEASERHGETASKAEFYRMMGAALLGGEQRNVVIKPAIAGASGGAITATPEACFRAALDLAHAQGATSLELRAALFLARVLMNSGRKVEALSILAEVRGRITEGLDTPDLREADQLLNV